MSKERKKAHGGSRVLFLYGGIGQSTHPSVLYTS